MNQENIEAILESPSAEILEGYPQDEIVSFLKQISPSDSFFSFIEHEHFPIHLTEEAQETYGRGTDHSLIFAAQLNNNLTKKPTGWNKALINLNGVPDPRNFEAVSEYLVFHEESRQALIDAGRSHFNSSSILGLEIRAQYHSEGVLRKIKPVLLIPHETFVFESSTVYSATDQKDNSTMLNQREYNLLLYPIRLKMFKEK